VEGALPKRQWIGYVGCALSIGVFYAFNNFTLTLWLSGLTTSLLLLSLLGNSKSVEGAVIAPIVGSWSDRTWAGPLGRRRIFILGGGVTSGLLMAATPALTRTLEPLAAGRVPADLVKVAPAVLVIFLFTLTANVMNDIHQALLPDIARDDQTNWLSSVSIVVQMVGQVGILVVGGLLWQDSIPDSAFALTGLLIAGGAMWTVLFVKEPSPEAWSGGAHVAKERHGLGFLREYSGAAVFIAAIFCFWSGVNAVLPLVAVFVRDILNATVGEAQILPGLLLLSTTIAAMPVGWLGNRYGKRRIISAGYAVMGLAGLAGMVISTKEQGAILFLLAGIGNAAAVVLTVPLMADLVPRRHMGAATGAIAAAGSFAAPIASFVGGALSDTFGPRAIFSVMFVMTLAALALMPFVKYPDPATIQAPAEPASPLTSSPSISSPAAAGEG
jgi:MFS family permease